MPPDATTYFSGLASTYDRNRPTYPRAAIRAVLEGLPRPVHAADIGCGTGISARLLAGEGAIVIGVDPNEDMLAAARAAGAPEGAAPIEYRKGAAEATGLRDASVDLVLCAQAFHWFNHEGALREFHRILKRRGEGGGRLALMWNLKQPSDDFSAGFCAVAEVAMADAATRGLIVPPERAADPTRGGWFRWHCSPSSDHGSESRATLAFANPQLLDLEGVLGRARSASYFPKSGPLRDKLETELRHLFAQHQRDNLVTLQHRTEIVLAERIDR